MREVLLTMGYAAIVDDLDFERVSQFKWHAVVQKRKDGSIRNVYAQRSLPRVNGRRPNQMLHRYILGVSYEIELDHRDHNGLHNWRANLRFCTSSQNQWNKRNRADNTSGVKGVHWNAAANKWQAGITVHKKFQYLGLYVNKRDAGAAYDAAAQKYHGDFAFTGEKENGNSNADRN